MILRPQIQRRPFSFWIPSGPPLDTCPAGPKYPAIAANVAVGDVAWSNPNNAKASDDSYATSVTVAQTTQQLQLTGFNFNIDPAKQIDGILVEVECKVLAGTDTVLCRIIKGGAVSSTSRSNDWTTTESFVSYGGSSDKWGETWTPANINASDFGVSIRMESGLTATLSCDSVRITVYCSIPSTIFTETLSDMLSLFENQSKSLDKYLPDPSTFSDSSASGLFKTLVERIDLSDVNLRYLFLQTLLSDAVNVLDSYRAMHEHRFGDIESPADSTISKQFRTLAERIEAEDAINTSANRFALLSDVLTLLDQYRAIHDRRVGESQSTNDANLFTHFRSLTERQEMNDIATLEKFGVALILLSLADSLHLSDDTIKALFNSIVDSELNVDATRKTLSKTVGDTNDVLDTLNRLLGKVAGDTQDVTDQVQIYLRLIRAAADTLPLSDEQLKRLNKSITDAVAINDVATIDRLAAFLVLALTDTLNLSDDQRKAIFKLIGDATLFDDSINRLLSSVMGDRQDVKDTVVALRLLSQVVADTVVPTDNALIRIEYYRLLSDTIDAVDRYIASHFRRFGDAEAAQDSTVSGQFKSLAERIDVLDVANTQAFRKALLADAFNVIDRYSAFHTRRLGEALSPTDSPVFGQFRSLTERQDILDTIITQISRVAVQLLLTDSVDARDVLVKSLFKLADEAASASDAVVKNIFKRAGDNAGASDTLASQHNRTIGDTLPVTDALVQRLLRVLLAIDFVDDRDEVIKQINATLADTAGNTDTLRKTLNKFVSESAYPITDSLNTSVVIGTALVLLVLAELIQSNDAIRKDVFKKLTEGALVNDTQGASVLRALLGGDTVLTRDALGNALTKVLGDTETVTEISIKVLATVLSEPELITDELIKNLRKTFIDAEPIADSVTATHIIAALSKLLLSDSLAVSDLTRKELLKRILDQAETSDRVNTLATRILIEFIESMLTGSQSVFGMRAGMAQEPRVVVKTVDPQRKDHRTRGTRK